MVNVFGVFSVGAAAGLLLRRCFDTAAYHNETDLDSSCPAFDKPRLDADCSACSPQFLQLVPSCVPYLGAADRFHRFAVCVAQRNQPAGSGLEVADRRRCLSPVCNLKFRFVCRVVELPFPGRTADVLASPGAVVVVAVCVVRRGLCVDCMDVALKFAYGAGCRGAASRFWQLHLPAKPPIDPPRPSTNRSWILWLALSACGSVLLLATTNHLTEDVAPVPLLWVVPLGVVPA